MSQAREVVVNRIKMQTILSNYGLPENKKYQNLNINEVRRRYKAIREFWVRLNLFIATGESVEGTIAFPEARRSIIYKFNGKTPEGSTVQFKALRKKR